MSGPVSLTHAAFAEGFVVADQIAGVDGAQPVDHVMAPRVTSCHPEVASVGLTQAEACEVYGDEVTVSTASMRGNAKGIIAGSDGFVKIITSLVGACDRRCRRTGSGARGAHRGPAGDELIGEATLATVREPVPVELAAITHAHPTLYEALGEAFRSAAGLPFHGD